MGRRGGREATVDEDAELNLVSGYVVRLQLEVIDDPDGGPIVVDVRGVLDSGTAATLRASSRFVAYHPAVIIELGRMEDIDQAGLGALVGLIRSVHETGGAIALCGARPRIDEVLRTSGLSRTVPITPTQREARLVLAPAFEPTLR
jgi:anti-anti-sigma factor